LGFGRSVRSFALEPEFGLSPKTNFYHRSLPRLRFMEPSGRIANVPASSALAQHNARSGEVKTYPNDDPRAGHSETIKSVQIMQEAGESWQETTCRFGVKPHSH
jgi:hypothetical protein